MARRALVRFAPAAIILALVGALFAQTRRLGLLGFDSYPIIASSRVRSLADLVGNFTEELMDGRYTSDFYRPLANFTFAWDHALWGLDPLGYQLTGALLLLGCAWALWALLRRLLGDGAWLGPVVGLAVFLLSPLQLEVLPVPPRRPELMCCGFMALALWLQLAPRALGSKGLSVWPAVATLLAIASKETGFVLPLLVALAVTLYSGRRTLRERLGHAATATAPHLAAAALLLGARLVVLGGIGGHRSLSASGIATATPEALGVLLGELLRPQPLMRAAAAAGWLLALLVSVLVATFLLAALRARPAGATALPLRAAIVGLAWIGLLGLTYAAAGLIGPWYLLLPLTGWALLVGALAEGLLGLVDHDDVPLRTLALAGSVLLIVLVVWQSSYSPLFRRYDEWTRASASADAFLRETRARIERAEDGTIVEAPPLPTWAAPGVGRPAVRGAAIFADYSVQAWADLVLPERRVRVRYAAAAVPPPAPDEVLLLITRRLDGV